MDQRGTWSSIGPTPTRRLEIRCYVRKDGTAKEHSPYWYFHYHEGGKQRTLYLGKTDDPEGELARKQTAR